MDDKKETKEQKESRERRERADQDLALRKANLSIDMKIVDQRREERHSGKAR